MGLGATNGTLFNYLVGNLLKVQRHVEAIITTSKVVLEMRSDVGRAGAWPLSPMSVRPAERQVQSNQPNQEITP